MSLAEEYGFDFSKEPCVLYPFSKYRCRKCLPCLLSRQKAWVSRLLEELRNHDTSYFVTLTYDDAHLPSDDYGQMMVSRQHIIKLNRDLRKRLQDSRVANPAYGIIYGTPKYLDIPEGIRYKYYITSEYGPSPTGEHRPHYHGVWYGLDVSIGLAEILFRNVWPYGFVQVLPAGEGAAGYISKYLVTDGVGKQAYTDKDQVSPFAIMSKGLGLSYVDRMADWHRQDLSRQFVQYHGTKSTMDRYLKHKIYTDVDLQPFTEQYSADRARLLDKYLALKEEHPMIYERIMSERAKFFNDQFDSIQWHVLKKHSLK